MKYMINKYHCYPKVEKIALSRRRKLIEKATRAERITRKYLKELDYNYRFQAIWFYDRGKFYIPDFFLPDYKIVIEIDGFHHSLKQQRMEDDLRTSRILRTGAVEVIRFSNSVCKKGEYFKQLLNRAINKCIDKHYGYKKL